MIFLYVIIKKINDKYLQPKENKAMKFRPAATPLITVDPFFSIWSTDDALYGGKTEHWSGRPFPIMAGIYVNGRFYSMSAFDMNEKAIVNHHRRTECRS